MRRFIKVELPPEPVINNRCVRKRLKQSLCDSCAKVCPVDAVNFAPLNVTIDNERCFQCGNCLFTCPVNAIENITPHERTYQDDRLIVDHDEPLASKEELLVWHRQFHIRAMQIAEPLVDKWLPILASLNLQLKLLEEPIWQLIITEPADIDTGRRFMLFRQKLDEKPLNKNHVKIGLNARKQLYPEDSWFQIKLDKESCILCSACANVCDEGAIELENNRFIIDEKRCTGCMNCEVVCFPKSIKVTEQTAKNNEPQLYHYHQSHCKKCHLSFFSWEPQVTLCPICLQHKKQGWL
ncbi:4Fe-4S binding protein [Proteus myxofaciens]|uniref:4Fe-4S binding protein n=1 Tax=Proteus myxofaciens TaxID=184072 RepID=UPI0008326E65|nr:4Fe-4S binding protein [Proteus myxofaciens]